MENNEISSSLSHKIVHLNSRPTQLYYEGVPPLLNNISDKSYQICEVRVSTSDIYITFDDSNKAYVDVFFHCKGWCCGVDCCQLSLTFIFAVSCVMLAFGVLLLNFIIRKIGQKLLMLRALRRFRLSKKHKKRVILRSNAQRRRQSLGKNPIDVYQKSILQMQKQVDQSYAVISKQKIFTEKTHLNKKKSLPIIREGE